MLKGVMTNISFNFLSQIFHLYPSCAPCQGTFNKWVINSVSKALATSHTADNLIKVSTSEYDNKMTKYTHCVKMKYENGEALNE